ncbi:MAG: glycosyltransferase [Myxococcaceae bacterium]
MNILLLHGWLLERSGSNVYTASLARQWVRDGHTVHLFCQERHPENLEFIGESIVYDLQGEPRVTYTAATAGPGRCVLHRPEIGDLLPVFNLDEYEGFSVVKRFVDMTEAESETYFAYNARALERVVRSHAVDIAFANHVYPNPTILERVKKATGLPYVVFPHGSCLEYAVKLSDRIKALTATAIDAADGLIVGNQVVTDRIWAIYPERREAWSRKHAIVSVGVDTQLFEPVARTARRASVDKIVAQGNPGNGKTAAQTAWLLERARGVSSDDALLALVREARGQYHYTSPDAELPAKLAAVDWTTEKTVLYVGKLIAGKGVHDLLLALPAALREAPNLRLVLVGESTFREALEILLMALSEGRGDLVEKIVRLGWALDERPQEEFEKARLYIEQVGMDRLLEWGRQTRPIERVLFAGYLNHARFRYLLPCADFTIFPSQIAEAYPLVLLESICAGALPMGSYFEGLKDGLDAISAGLPADVQEDLRIRVEPKRKIAEIAEKLPRLLRRPETYTDYCRDLAVKRFSWESVAHQMLDELRKVLERTGKPAR